MLKCPLTGEVNPLSAERGVTTGFGSHSNKGSHFGGNLVLFGLFRAQLYPCTGAQANSGRVGWGGARPEPGCEKQLGPQTG